ncbi:MAG TPA: hypothetical protein DCF63_06385 [Planctomycetaceae bacterium]|nr:hypothetical protein [Planctomycetaceae bacterium]
MRNTTFSSFINFAVTCTSKLTVGAGNVVVRVRSYLTFLRERIGLWRMPSNQQLHHSRLPYSGKRIDEMSSGIISRLLGHDINAIAAASPIFAVAPATRLEAVRSSQS